MASKNCSGCKNPLEEHRLGKQRYCLACHRKHMQKTRPKHSELDDYQKLKANARSYLNVYMKRGYIFKQSCSICGSEKSEAHHEDYNKPLEVIWFCRSCHLDFHKQKNLRNEQRRVNPIC